MRDSGDPGDAAAGDAEMKDDNLDEDSGKQGLNPAEIRLKLLREKRKKFARKWFTKYNQYKRNIENMEISKRGRASSGIGEERIQQMEVAHKISCKTRSRGPRRGRGFYRGGGGGGRYFLSSPFSSGDIEPRTINFKGV